MMFQEQYDTSYSVAPDRQHFLMLKGESRATPTQLNIVLGWSMDLARRVPVK